MKKINIWSFILSIICILLFFIVSFSGPIDYSLMGTHPLNLVLYITLITFVLGVLGFSGIQDWIRDGEKRNYYNSYIGIISVFNFHCIFWKLVKLKRSNS